jgi:hypothetical protein
MQVRNLKRVERELGIEENDVEVVIEKRVLGEGRRVCQERNYLPYRICINRQTSYRHTHSPLTNNALAGIFTPNQRWFLCRMGGLHVALRGRQTRTCPEPLYQQIWYTGSSGISPRTETSRSGKGSTRPGPVQNHYANRSGIQAVPDQESVQEQTVRSGRGSPRPGPVQNHYTNRSGTRAVLDQESVQELKPTDLVKAVPDQDLSRTIIPTDLVHGQC